MITRRLPTIVLLALAATVHAQEPAPVPAPSEPVAEPTRLSTAELAARADKINAEVIGLQNALQVLDAKILDIPEQRAELAEDLDDRLAGLDSDEVKSLSSSDAESLSQRLLRMDAQLQAWRMALERRVNELEEQSTDRRAEQEFIANLLKQSAELELPAALTSRLQEVLTRVEAVRESVAGRISLLLDELAKISALELRINDARQALRGMQLKRASDLLEQDQLPLWQALMAGPSVFANVGSELRARFGSAAEFYRARQGDTATFFALFALSLVVAAIWRIRRSRAAADTETLPSEYPDLFARRPFALVALLWGVIGVELLLAPLPVAGATVRTLVVAIALLRIAPLVLGDRVRGIATVLLLLAAAANFLQFLPTDSLERRLLMLAIGVLGAVFFRQLHHRLPEIAEARQRVWLLIGKAITIVAPYTMAAGILALILGLVVLGQQLVRGTLLLLMVLLGTLSLEIALVQFLESMVTVGAAAGFRSLSSRPELLRSRMRTIVRLLMLLLFATLIAQVFPIIGTAWDWVVTFLTDSRTFGTADFSISSILVLLFSVVLAVFVARMIRILLNDDVLPRLSVAPGAAEAASRLLYYALVTAGVLFSIAAAGVELSRLTLVISALGVGIGFGLQSIVNNFVSGLILSFERPIQVGDTIVVGALTGRVTRIGLRSTRIRTFDGAEVIVPNADLISNNVVNWTLSDRTRRLDLPVTVAYGSDMAKVKETLLQVAADNETVSKTPAPDVLFQGFGDSALEVWLRIWLPDAGDWPKIRSDLYYAIDEAFRDAGIEIPFPQRTVHLQRDGVTESI